MHSLNPVDCRKLHQVDGKVDVSGAGILVLALEAVASLVLQGHGFYYFEESTRGMRNIRRLTVDHAQLAMQPKFAHWNSDQVAAGKLALHADFRQQDRKSVV